MALANKALGRESTSFASYTQAALPAAVTLTDEEVEARSALVTTESIERSIELEAPAEDSQELFDGLTLNEKISAYEAAETDLSFIEWCRELGVVTY